MILHAVVDNIEENKVLLLIAKKSSNEERVVIFPAEFLPPNIGMGDLLKISITTDPQEKANRVKEIENLWKELGVE